MLQYLIVCLLVFLAGLADFVAGGGGLITLPAYLIAGVLAHVALGTNKLSPAMGTTASTARLTRHGFLKGKVFMVVCSSTAIPMNSALGAHLAFMVPESVIRHMVIVVLSAAALYVLRNKDTRARDRMGDISRNKVFAISMATAFFMGGCDDFHGPGTGVLPIPALTGAAGMDARSASVQTKVINFSSNITVLVTFTTIGNVYYPLGLTAGVCSVVGHYIGVGMMTHDGQKVVRPVVLMVLRVLSIKIISST